MYTCTEERYRLNLENQIRKSRSLGKDFIMSSFVTSDYTVLAIVEGMRKYKLISKSRREAKDMADALRVVNEYMTTKRYDRNSETGKWAIYMNHQEVTAVPREFTDAEILQACDCWVYQVDTGEPMDFDFITLVSAVKMLKETLIAANKKAETVKVKCYFGEYRYFFLDKESGEFVDSRKVGWDLAELPKAA